MIPRPLFVHFCAVAFFFCAAPLRLDAQATVAPPPPVADAAHAKWETEIAAFEKADRANPPKKGAILFIGSSSIRLWKSLAADFPTRDVINRGFGGSQIDDSVYFADRIVFPYAPRLIVLYAGGNDINAGKSVDQVVKDFKGFVEKVHTQLPQTQIAYISIAGNPARWAQVEKVKAVNARIAAMAEHGIVTGDVLSGSGGCKHRQKEGEISQVRHDLFDADQGDVNLRQRGGQTGVSFILGNRNHSRIRNDEVAAGNTHVCFEILPAQKPAGDHCEFFGTFGVGGTEFALEQRTDLIALQMHAWKDEVIRRLAGELLNKLAEITLDDLVSGRLQRGVEMNFFARHRLRFHDRANRARLGNAENILTCRRTVARPKNLSAARRKSAFELAKIVIEMRDRLRLDPRRGIAAVCHIEDYERDIIKKHEKTRRDKEDDRTRLIATLRADTGPVFLTYRDNAAIDQLITEITRGAPLSDFVAPDGIGHTVWRIGDCPPWINAFSRIPVAYVADGHHRTASAVRVGREQREANPQHTGAEEYNWFLAVLFPASQLQILPYNRAIADLHGRGDLREFHGKHPAESATSFGVIHLDEFEAAHRAQQLPRCLLCAEFTQSVAAIMKSGTPDKMRTNVRDTKFAHEEFAKLKSLLRELPRGRFEWGTVKQLRVKHSEHCAARTGC